MSLLPRFVTENASLKLLAFVGAVFLWAIVPGDPQGQEVLSSVPLQVQVADLDWVAVGDPEPAQVQVRLSGPTREIIRLARQGTRMRIPVEGVHSEDSVVTLRREWLDLGGVSDVVVDEVVPQAVLVRFEPAGSRAVPLRPRLRGSLPDGLVLAQDPGVNPTVVRVRGPARRLDRIDEIELEPLDLSAIDVSGIFEVPVDSTGLEGLVFSPRTVSVGIRVERIEERRREGVPWELEDAPTVWGVAPRDSVRVDELDVEPASVALVLTGAPSRLGGAAAQRIRVVGSGAVLGELEPGASTWIRLEARDVPPQVQARVVPDSIRVSRPVGGAS